MKKYFFVFFATVLFCLVPSTVFAAAVNQDVHDYQKFESIPITVRLDFDRFVPDFNINTSSDNYFFVTLYNSNTKDYAILCFYGATQSYPTVTFDGRYVELHSGVSFKLFENPTSDINLLLSNSVPNVPNPYIVGPGLDYNVVVSYGGAYGSQAEVFVNSVNDFYEHYFRGLVTGWVVDGSELNPVLNEVVSGLPILIPVLIIFVSIRKAIRFTLGLLRSA